MATQPRDLDAIAAQLASFGAGRLTTRIGAVEDDLQGATLDSLPGIAKHHGIAPALLASAIEMKKASAQIDVLIHAVGITLALRKLLEPGESIEYVSLGAGNTGRRFDLETDRRVAEFKFIHWQGSSETIRQNGLFKDFYLLAEHPTPKQKQLFVLDIERPLRFLRGDRALSSVLSKSVSLWGAFQAQYGARFARVGEYFAFREPDVEIVDVSTLLE